MRPKWMRPGEAIGLATLLITLSPPWLIASDKPDKLDERQRAIHALNRLTFGPRPGDVDRVMAMGVDKWIELQLNPGKIDDSALETRLAQFRTLNMNTREMLAEFPPPQALRQVAAGKLSMPRDPEKKAVYEAAIERYQNKQEKKQKNGPDNAQLQGQTERQDEESMSDDMTPEGRAQRRDARQQARAEGERLMAMSPDERMDAILKMQPDERAALARALSPDEKFKLVDGMSPKQKETVLALANPFAVSSVELMQAKLDRAVYSERQLDEVMADFWFNHFNVFIGKGPDRYLITAYERDVIRPRALGKFKDLLMATAQSPAMLFYLDNWESVGPNSQAALNRERVANGEMPERFGRRGRFARPLTQQQQDRLKKASQNAPKGLNENYAR